MNVLGRVHARNCSFTGGNAYQGGALYTWMWGSLLVEHCTFVNNTAIAPKYNTGGAIFTDRGSALIVDSTFQGNIANASGGAIYAWSAHGKGNGGSCCQNVSIVRCVFRDNVAHGKRNAGGAIGNQWSTFSVVDSQCEGNLPQAIWTDTGSTTNVTGGTC